MAKFRKQFDGERKRVSLDVKSESVVQQAFKDECDVNRILKKYDKTGIITHVARAQAQYGDFTQVNEYQVALNTVIQAQASFEELPSSVRKKFGNDPGAFIEFVTNPANADEMVTLGLAQPKVEPEPMLVKIAAESAADV
jgi:phage internal scaffolding protein